MPTAKGRGCVEMLIFLDFDGVLHPAPPHNRDAGVLSCMERFEDVMREFPSWSIVISSSWRQAFSLDVIKGFFSDDIAGRVHGMTPVLDADLHCLKQREIEQYLVNTGQSHMPWLALDDQAGEFDEDMPNLVLCDPARGFDEISEATLRKKMMAAA